MLGIFSCENIRGTNDLGELRVMGPILLVPFIAAVALLMGTAETPPQQKEVKTEVSAPVKGLVETYRCSLYNRLLDVDDLPDSNENRFLILDLKEPQKYAQVWLSDDHYFADYEISSLYYEYKNPSHRHYWPDSVSDVIQREGFSLRSGVHGNFQRSVQLPKADALVQISESMLRVMEQGFEAKNGELKVNIGGHPAPPLLADQPCRALSKKQQARAPMPADGGVQGFEAAYNASLSNRLHILAGAPAKTLFHTVLSADGSVDKIVRLSGHGAPTDVMIEVPVQTDPARLAVLKDMGFDLNKSKGGYYSKFFHLKNNTMFWTAGDRMLELSYRLYGAKIGEARLSPLFRDDQALDVSAFERLAVDQPSDYEP